MHTGNQQGALSVYGGSGSDVLALSQAAQGALYGGPGRDQLAGGPLGDAIFGGTGRDRLLGGDGRDTLQGGPGDDQIDGGPGTDLGAWWEHTMSVAIDLQKGEASAGAERDTLTSIENATGGRGDDLLVGDSGPNRLAGGKGDDVLAGAGGNDRLIAGGGRRDRVRCGTGRDLLLRPGLRAIGRDCEQLSAPGTDYKDLNARPIILGARRWMIQVASDSAAANNRRRVILSVAGREIGRSSMTRVDGERRDLKVTLSRPVDEGEIVRVHIEGTQDYDDVSAPTDAPLITTSYSFDYRLRR